MSANRERSTEQLQETNELLNETSSSHNVTAEKPVLLGKLMASFPSVVSGSLLDVLS